MTLFPHGCVFHRCFIGLCVRACTTSPSALPSRKAAYGLWNLSNSSLGTSTIMDLGLVPEILAIYEPITWG